MQQCARAAVQICGKTSVLPCSRTAVLWPCIHKAVHSHSGAAALSYSNREKCDLSARLLIFLCQIVNFLYELLTSGSIRFGHFGAPPKSDCPNRKLTQNRGRLAGPKTGPIRQCFKESLQGRVRFLDPKMGPIFASESDFWTPKWVPFFESDKSKINASPIQCLQIKATRKRSNSHSIAFLPQVWSREHAMCPDERPIVHAMILPTFWHRALGFLIAPQQSCQRLFRLRFFSFLVAITSLAIITASTNSTSNTINISAIISTRTAGITYMIKIRTVRSLVLRFKSVPARRARL